ncbi:glycosyltransferase family 2 protein [Liquorilactobacillus cacaonum]|uniref:Glycosyltransferase 2-like domain-containing protein n=1 Tax=Liquorilactobacillus cacaonum DSM 21116 TaxID=1423729 RepID=A0A0R2CI15_9LACO|nr:glycosyltransferase family 2 protein [Liquorilactobacillus cacaonum]KRM91127.1 hypothetical protein FC80_GL001126 [Liquorilactobacillus cacaonum DSM 21116]
MIIILKENYKPFISVIVPVYNVYPYIEKCLNTLLEQTASSEFYEVITINDGSTDQSESIIKNFEGTFSNLRVYNRKNEGVSATRNFGISVSRGKYITFIDADDWVEADYIEKLMLRLKKSKIKILSFGYCKEKNKIKSKKNSYRKNFFINEEFDSDLFYKINNICSLYNIWNKAYEKNFLVKNNIYFEKLVNGEDAVFNMLAYHKSTGNFFSKDLLYHYTIRRNGSASSNLDQKYIEDGDKVNYFIDEIFKDDKTFKLKSHQSINVLFTLLRNSKNLKSYKTNTQYASLIKKVRYADLKKVSSSVKFLLVKCPYIFALLRLKKS